jgi:hypothetical protein
MKRYACLAHSFMFRPVLADFVPFLLGAVVLVAPVWLLSIYFYTLW